MLNPATYFMVLALVVGGALVHGATTQRWNLLETNKELTEKLHQLEIRWEDWKPTDVPTELPTHERCSATSRRYDSAKYARTMMVSLISGIPGSVATHTPDVCYPSSGYKTLRGVRKENFTLPDGRTGTCYVADFEKKTQTKRDRLRVRWAWLVDGQWVAPDRPRWQFAGELRAPTLYKVYVIAPLPDDSDTQSLPEDDPITTAFVLATWSQYAAAVGH